jgi:hypothetical protein
MTHNARKRNSYCLQLCYEDAPVAYLAIPLLQKHCKKANYTAGIAARLRLFKIEMLKIIIQRHDLPTKFSRCQN